MAHGGKQDTVGYSSCSFSELTGMSQFGDRTKEKKTKQKHRQIFWSCQQWRVLHPQGLSAVLSWWLWSITAWTPQHQQQLQKGFESWQIHRMPIRPQYHPFIQKAAVKLASNAAHTVRCFMEQSKRLQEIYKQRWMRSNACIFTLTFKSTDLCLNKKCGRSGKLYKAWPANTVSPETTSEEECIPLLLKLKLEEGFSCKHSCSEDKYLNTDFMSESIKYNIHQLV